MYNTIQRTKLGSKEYAVHGYEETDISTLTYIVYEHEGHVVRCVEYDPLGKLSQKEKETVWTDKSSTTINVE